MLRVNSHRKTTVRLKVPNKTSPESEKKRKLWKFRFIFLFLPKTIPGTSKNDQIQVVGNKLLERTVRHQNIRFTKRRSKRNETKHSNELNILKRSETFDIFKSQRKHVDHKRKHSAVLGISENDAQRNASNENRRNTRTSDLLRKTTQSILEHRVPKISAKQIPTEPRSRSNVNHLQHSFSRSK